MFSKFNEEVRKILVNAKKETMLFKHSYVGTEHFILAILSSKSSIKELLNSYDVYYDSFKEKVNELIGVGDSSSTYFVYSPLLKKIIQDAIINCKDRDLKEINTDMLFLSMLDMGEGSAFRILLNMNVPIDELYEKIVSSYSFKKKKNNLLVNQYGVCLNTLALNDEIDPVIGREEETNRVIEILCRRCKNNPLLIGEAGVGKTAIVENLARRIALGDVPYKLSNKKIISLSMASLVSGTKYRGEFEERVTKLIKEAEEDQNVILFLDEVHTLVGAGGAEGAIDASNILKPALARGKISIIGATTNYEYKKTIENDKALSRRFQNVFIEEPDNVKVFDILSRLREVYEKYHNVVIDDDILKLIIKLTSKYMYNKKEPDRSIDILDEACSKTSIMEDDVTKKTSYYKGLLRKLNNLKNNAINSKKFDEALYLREEELKLETCINKLDLKKSKNNKLKVVTKDVIASVIASKTGVFVFELSNKNEVFEKLKDSLKEKIFGQNEVIDELISYTKNCYSGIKVKDVPLSFLFVGPNFVGKTSTALIYGEGIFGKNNIIKIDGNMYRESHTVSNLIGSPLGYKDSDSKKSVIDEIRDKPYSLILISNIDKMHRDVLNIIMDILKDGRIRDSLGNIYKFNSNTIIMTMNKEFKNNNLGFSNNIENVKIREIPNELLNRIRKVFYFKKLDDNNIKDIITYKINNIEVENNIVIKDKDELKNKIFSECNYIINNAYEIDNLIESNISKYTTNR